MLNPARYWRELPQRYRYEAAKCEKCGKIWFPPRLVCSACGGRHFAKHTLAQEGKIETYTIIRVPPAGFGDQAPYAVGIIALDDGAKLTAQIVDCKPEDLAIGKRVRLEFRRIQTDGESGIIAYGYKFVLAA